MLAGDNQNSVILKLDALRHFMFVNDKRSFTTKKDCAIFRGKIRDSRIRTQFIKMYINHPLCDCGVVGHEAGIPRGMDGCQEDDPGTSGIQIYSVT